MENLLNFQKSREKNIHLCRTEIPKKSLINRKKKGKITNIIECYKCREINNKGVNYMAKMKKSRKKRSEGLRKNRRSVLMITFVIMIFGGVVLGCGLSLKEKNEVYLAKEEELQLQIDAELERSEEIDELKEYVETDEYIEMVAKEKLGLAYENEILFEAQK